VSENCAATLLVWWERSHAALTSVPDIDYRSRALWICAQAEGADERFPGRARNDRVARSRGRPTRAARGRDLASGGVGVRVRSVVEFLEGGATVVEFRAGVAAGRLDVGVSEDLGHERKVVFTHETCGERVSECVRGVLEAARAMVWLTSW